MSAGRRRRRRLTLTDIDDPLTVLLRRAGRGDQQAFGDLYDELSPLVFGVVLKVVRDPSQSEEVAQEVFVELWRLAARFDSSRGSVTRGRPPWPTAGRSTVCVRSSRRVTGSSVRRRTRRSTTTTSSLRSRPTSTRVRVRRALGQLSPLQREAVELAYFGGHTYREVAVLLDVAEGTVKTRIRDGMIRLRDEFGGES